ncbi:MAG: hypothetical protein WAZ12_00195 [Candidatus Absconditicoccaceae bacterium]
MKPRNQKFLEIFLWIITIVTFNTISYFLETRAANMSSWIAFILRLSTVIVDIFLLKYVLNLRIYYRRQFKNMFPKKTRIVSWLADTTTLTITIYSLYVLKLIFFFIIKQISLETFLYALAGGLLIAILFGRPISWFIRYQKKYFKTMIRKRLSKKAENEKNNASSGYTWGGFFILGKSISS